jgi:predicted  nucleic acid-binding Zn-ribbon protein
VITFEQIQLLDNKVHKEENVALQTSLTSYEKRIEELELLIDSFKRDQGKIEEGILSALKQLDSLESSVAENENAAEPESVSEPESEPAAAPEIITGETEQEEDPEESDRNGELDIF